MSDKLRVNLQFGARADRGLLDELRSLPPYRRAKLARQLMSEGWRARNAPVPPDVVQETCSVALPPTPAHAPKALEDELMSAWNGAEVVTCFAAR